MAGLLWLCLASPEAFSEQGNQAPVPNAGEELILKESVVCESSRDNLPVNAGVVFPVAIGRIVCLSSFNPASRRATVFHSWYHRDKLANKQRLSIYPSGSTALSSVQLREADKGPWVVEISDGSGRTLKVLRFSIVD